MAQGFRVTYATMSADNEELQAKYDEAAERMKGELGKEYPFIVNGEERWTDEKYEEPSPIDSDIIIGRFSQATPKDVDDAVAAAKGFQLEWDRMGWQARVEIMRNVADIMEDRLFDLAALMAYEVGKSRLEALGDVQETAELIRWNADEMEKHEGFRTPMSGMGAAGDYYDVLRPYGVWAVISPFNFPMALSGGPSVRRARRRQRRGLEAVEPGRAAGLQALRVLPRRRRAARRVPPGDRPGRRGRRHHLWKHPDVGGITFTGSYPVGMDIYKHFATEVPKPVICEMGGKNPAIVTKNADLDKATDGVLRSAFGFGGQKCSACSRVFVEREVYDDFLGLLKQKTEKIKVGNPLERDVYLGPIINEPAMETFEEAAEEARKNGTIVTGGQRITEGDFARGLFVEPTVVEVPADNWIWKKELFVPFVAVAPFDELDEAIEKANDTEYGLTAGFFSEDQAEIDEWLDRIQAGVVYVNRRAGATTGAWPGVQPFGGWKGSGTTGKAGGGPYYVTQYLREQSRTVISE